MEKCGTKKTDEKKEEIKILMNIFIMIPIMRMKDPQYIGNPKNAVLKPTTVIMRIMFACQWIGLGERYVIILNSGLTWLLILF